MRAAVTASISCAVRVHFSRSPFKPICKKIFWIRLRSFDGISSAFRVDAGCTSIMLVPSFLIFSAIFIALCVSFSIVRNSGGKTGYPFLCISLSVCLSKSFIGRLSGASIATRIGLQFNMDSKISSSVYSWHEEISMFFHVAHPVGFFGIPAKSIPMMIFCCNFDFASQFLIIGSCFR